MKKIVITGAEGFIGKNFTNEYCREYEIIPISRESKYNILSLNSLEKLENIDVIIHLAAKTFIPDSFKNPYDFYKFNIESTLNIAELCRIKNIKKVIYLNSYTYGTPNYLPIDEKHKLAFHSPYNKSKHIAEDILFKYLEKDFNVISLRLFNIYGEYQGNNFLIPTILKQLKKGTIHLKDLEPKRDYLYIKDFTKLLNLLVEKKHIDNGVYNIGSGKSHSVKEILENIKELCNYDFNIIAENKRRKNEILDCYADISKINAQINWTPEYSLKEGLKDYLEKVKLV